MRFLKFFATYTREKLGMTSTQPFSGALQERRVSQHFAHSFPTSWRNVFAMTGNKDQTGLLKGDERNQRV